MSAAEEYQEPTLDLARGRAQRYAEALAAAAGAGERIRQLTEALESAEYLRDVAETQLSGVEWDKALGRVWTAADGEEPETGAVMDLHDGTVYWRRKDGTGWAKRLGGRTVSTAYQWPPEGGPWISFEETWELNRVFDESERLGQLEDRLHRHMSDRDGYQEPGKSTWHRPDLVQALERVLAARDAKRLEAAEEARKAKAEADELRKKLDEMVPPAHQRVHPVLERFRQTLVDEAGRSPHALVKQAELEIIQDVDVPEDGGDPSYSRDRLLQAAAWLVAAAAGCEGGDLPF